MTTPEELEDYKRNSPEGRNDFFNVYKYANHFDEQMPNYGGWYTTDVIKKQKRRNKDPDHMFQEGNGWVVIGGALLMAYFATTIF